MLGIYKLNNINESLKVDASIGVNFFAPKYIDRDEKSNMFKFTGGESRMNPLLEEEQK